MPEVIRIRSTECGMRNWTNPSPGPTGSGQAGPSQISDGWHVNCQQLTNLNEIVMKITRFSTGKTGCLLARDAQVRYCLIMLRKFVCVSAALAFCASAK